MKKTELITIVAQAFYGNRTCTQIRKDDVDGVILGHVDGSVAQWDKMDRGIVKVPNTDNLVLIYNKYSEEQRLRSKEICLKDDGYEMKPVATIPDVPVELYSRCIASRANEAGGVESLQPEDFDKFMKLPGRIIVPRSRWKWNSSDLLRKWQT